MKNVVRETLNPSVPICQEAVDAVGKGTGLEILREDGIRELMVPIRQEDRRCIAFGPQERAQLGLVARQRLKGPTSRRRRMDHQRAADGIVVVCTKV